MAQKNAFTLIEFLIALVIIGFIVAILVGVFSSPVKQAALDAAVVQAKDGLRQIEEAQQKRTMSGAAPFCDENDLVINGYLSALPAIPTAALATSGDTNVRWDHFSRQIAACDAAPQTVPDGTHAGLRGGDGVSLEFCKAFNASMGLPAQPMKNCADPSNPCTATGDTMANTTCNPGAQMWCFDYNGSYQLIIQAKDPGSC